MTKRPVNSRVKHGDPSCADYGCRREECLQARRRKQKKNKLLRDTGRPGMIAPDRAAAHISQFREAGFQDKDIIAMMGLARNTFYRIMRGLPLTRSVEQRVLSVPKPRPAGQVSTLSTVPGVGTHRRLRALLWQGWPLGVLEARLEVHAGWIARSTRRKNVTMAVERRVRELYDELWNVVPETAGIAPEWAGSTRRSAASSGFNGPLAWDDDTIDDPNALPLTDAVQPVVSAGGNLAARYLAGEAVILDTEARKEVLAHRFEWSNDTIAEIAAELGMTPAAAEQAWNRMKKKAKDDGKRLWRRVYVARERDLKQNEMEEAA